MPLSLGAWEKNETEMEYDPFHSPLAGSLQEGRMERGGHGRLLSFYTER